MSDFLYESKRRELEELAEFIADDYFPNSAIDPEIIAKKKQITFSYGNYGDYFDGLIQCKENRFHIFINDNDSNIRTEERKRFTFGHELGHYFIDNHRNVLKGKESTIHKSVTGFVTNSIMEKEADYFASCLLIPYNRLVKECIRKKFDFELLLSLSSKFKSSLTSTAIKIASKNLYPIFIISATEGKIDWCWPSNTFPLKWLKNGKESIPISLITGKYHKNKVKVNKTEVFKAEDFFQLNSQNDKSRYFNERCIYITDSKTITFIWEYII